MELLRDTKILILDEATEACQLAADHFAEMHRMTEERGPTQLFAGLAEDHRQDVAQLEAQVKELGELPRQVDPDREALEHLSIWARTVVGDNKQETLLDKAEELEKQVIYKVTIALSEDLPANTRSLLFGIRHRVDNAMRQIKATRKT
jgi:hypothetical protein